MNFRHFTQLFPLLIGALLAGALPAAAGEARIDSAEQEELTRTTTESESSELEFQLADPSLHEALIELITAPGFDLDDYMLECDGRPSVHYGNLTLTQPWHAERHRCIRTVTGNLTVDPDNQHAQLVLPWLQAVHGKLKLDANPFLGRVRLPRLHLVLGEIEVETWTGSTRFEMVNLTAHAGTLLVDAGTQADLSGLDNLVELGRLELYNRSTNAPQNPQFPHFSGLEGLEVLGDLEIDCHEPGSADVDFLASLAEVTDDVIVDTADALFALEYIEVIGGDLDVYVGSLYGSTTAAGLDSLQEVGGDFIWDGTTLSSISALSNLREVGGDLELPLSVTSLAGFGSLERVGGDFTLAGPIQTGTLAALWNLYEVGGTLEISGTPLSSLSGLDNVSALGGLRIAGNWQLGNVASLGGALVSGGGQVEISSNSPLTTCQANSLVAQLQANGWQGSASVWGNQTCLIYLPSTIFRF